MASTKLMTTKDGKRFFKISVSVAMGKALTLRAGIGRKGGANAPPNGN